MHSMLVQDVVRVQGRLKAMYGARDIATPGTSSGFYDEGAEEDLRALRAFEARRILDDVEAQLAREPMKPTKRRKRLEGLVPPWDSARAV